MREFRGKDLCRFSLPGGDRLTPNEFIRKWSDAQLRERQASQEQFIDICRMLGQKTPAEADPRGEWYCFEKGATKQDGADGWADVWRKDCFAWEYKGKKKDLAAAYDQLLRYRESLGNPPLLVVSDMERFQIHTNFTGTQKVVHEFALADLERKESRDKLLALFEAPERLKPGRRVEEVTEKAAAEFASLAEGLRRRGTDPKRGAHFLNRILFCLFAEDVGLLPRGIFAEIVQSSDREPSAFADMLRELFAAMVKGGRFGTRRIHYFDGGLFSDAEVIPLEREEIAILDKVARLDWSQIEPAIFGTLFERGLDPSKRSQLGAHYTDRESILRVVDPVLMAPLRREWEKTRANVDELLAKARSAKSPGAATGARNQASKAIEAFRTDHLDRTVVLDPACGSGNFLYLALERLHELEKEVLLKLAEVQKGQTSLDVRVGPHMLKGIEINAYAHELAQVTIWIGHLQWHVKNGFGYETNPVLKPIEAIECRDAILDVSDPTNPREPAWPEATVIVSNPPFLGNRLLRRSLGNEYVEALFGVYEGRLPGSTDLVGYWFEKARAAVAAGRTKRVGLLATQGIRGQANRAVLTRIKESGDIFCAWSDRPWVLNGAAVHVSFVCFDDGAEIIRELDGSRTDEIHADLTSGVNLTRARPLPANAGVAFYADVKAGPFDISAEVAKRLLQEPNPDGRVNSDVVRPWINAEDITGRSRGRWIIDFGIDMPEEQAALYQAPYEYVRTHVLPNRRTTRRQRYRDLWWLHAEPCGGMRAALARLSRYIATPATGKHRLFVWIPIATLPDHAVVVFARDDDYSLGVLQCATHERWSRGQGTQLREAESGCRYTPTTCLETFPFPPLAGGISREVESVEQAEARAQIMVAARDLVKLRDGWLNPAGISAADLKKRTLTSLYNDRPTWLEHAHLDLDRAVLAAYGWPETWAEGLQPRRDAKGKVNPELGVVDPAVEQEVLSKLLALNLQASTR